MTMLYSRQAIGDINAIGRRLEDAVKARKFGILLDDSVNPSVHCSP